jgi:ribonuclease E
MDERKNNASVEKRIKDRLKSDRARIQVGRISGFGLLEMSRQRLRPGMLEATTQSCQSCHGTGLIRSDDNLSLSILRQIEEEGVRKRSEEVLVKCPVSIANFIMNQKRDYVASIEKNYGLSVRIEGNLNLVSPEYSIEKLKSATRILNESEPALVTADGLMELSEEENVIEGLKDEDEKPKKRRRRRRKKKPFSSEDDVNSKQEYSEEHQLPSEANPNEVSSSDENLSNNSTVPPKKKNKRGNRKEDDILEDANNTADEKNSSIEDRQLNQTNAANIATSESEAKGKNIEKLPQDDKEKKKRAPKRQKENQEIDKIVTNEQENDVENSKKKRKGWWSLKS